MENSVMNQTASNYEALSALADGEMGVQEAARLVQATAGDESLRAAWQHYHVIGDVLRSASRDTHDTRAALPASTAPVQPMPLSPPAHITETVAANDSVWRWKLVAGFAAVAAVGSIVWSLAAGVGGGASQPIASTAQLSMAVATVASSPAAQEEAAVMIRDPRLDELLAAHKQFGGASALQPAGFLRNATFQAPQR